MDTSRPINRGPGRRPYAALTRQAVDAAPALSFPEEPLPADLKPVGAEPAAPTRSAPLPAAYAARAVIVHVRYHNVAVDLYRADLPIDQVEKLVDQILARDGWGR